MRKILQLSLIFVLTITTVMAQDRTISGKVTDAKDGQPIPGVNVLVKGTSSGAITDIDGNYKLAVPSGATTLVFSFVGYQSTEVELGSRAVIDIAMETDVQQLTEVVVVGYGTTLKQDLMGNVANVAGEEVELQPVTTVEQAIQGRTAGVLITSQNGKLGQAMDIRIRGASSISASNQPLYVIDGVPVTSNSQSSSSAATNPLADLNFNDIESIEVLKDASAASIYGSRGTNGVILITTKKGKTGKTSFDLNVQYGSSSPTKNREWINADEYILLYSESAFNNDQAGGGFADLTVDDVNAGNYGSLESHPDYPGSWLEFMVDYMDFMDGDYIGDGSYSSINAADTDWQQEAYQPGNLLGVDLSASGGTDATRYYISGSYSGQDGILIGNQFERMSGRLNLDHDINAKVGIGVNYNIARTENRRVTNDNFFSTPIQLVAQSPITPVSNENGLLDNALNPGAIYYPATVERENSDYVTTVFRNLLNTYLAWDITKGLTFRAEYGFDLLTQDEQQYQNSKTLTGRSVGGYGRSRWVQIFNYTTKGYFNWNPDLGTDHNLDVVLGMEFQESTRKQTNVEGQDYPVDQLKTVASASEIVVGSSTLNEFAFVGYFLRANYKLFNRFLFGATVRVDGSSRFGENNKYGTFPSASLGYIMSEESFMQGSVMSFLKLRGSYGLTGNAEIGNYNSYGTYSAASYNNGSGLAPNQIANPDLTWETTAQTNLGLDFGFWDDKLTGGFDYYIKNTSDLLLFVPIPGTTGFRTQLQNVGDLENKGYEFLLNYRLVAGDFEWSTGVNISNNENKITFLPGEEDPNIIDGSNMNKVVEGHPIGVFWGIEFAGANPDTGDAEWFLPSGERTSDYSLANAPENRRALGNPTPTWTYGWNNTFRYKGFDLSLLIQGVSGNQIYLSGDRFMAANARYEDNQTKDQLARWRKPGDDTMIPQARLYRTNGAQLSSRYLSDGAYLRLKNLSFGYTFPKRILDNMKLTNLRLYMNASNLVTVTDYIGWDPEVNADYNATNINLGTDFYSAPQPRTFTFGVRVGF